MSPRVVQQLRTAALVAATVLLGISWSFALLHVRTRAYPALWSGAMPFLAFYYISSSRRLGSWKHLPAAALSIYAVILWQVCHGYGLLGSLCAVIGVGAGAAALWLGSTLASRRTLLQQPVVPASRGAGATRRRLRTQGARR